jgi:hypothetical protein
MRRPTLCLPIVAAMLAIFAAAPAFAGYGTLARDPASGKVGLSWDKPTQHEADAAAMRDCAESSCKIVFRTHPHQCGAIAVTERADSTAWGGGVKQTRAEAELTAINDCQKHTAGHCKVQAAGCNH